MAETDSEAKEKDDVYFDRNVLALAFVCLRYEQGYEAGWWPDTDDVNGEEWAVVWTNLHPGGGQVGWHVRMEMVPDGLPKLDPEYDGYTTDEKNARMMAFFLHVVDGVIDYACTTCSATFHGYATHFPTCDACEMNGREYELRPLRET